MIEQLQSDFEAIQTQVNSLGSRVSSIESGAHSHFNGLLSHPNLHASYTLRSNDQYTTGRGWNLPVNPLVAYDPQLDAAKVTIDPFLNELVPGQPGSFMLWWQRPEWEIGSKLVVQFEVMISQAMHDHVPKPGINGRFTDGYKFTNLCRGQGQITYEIRTFFTMDPIDTIVNFRSYNNGLESASLEGRLDKDFASDVRNPTATFVGTGGGYDTHPGPDSYLPYRSPKRPPDPAHPTCFRWRSHRWIRVTYELERVAEGTRVRTWFADDATDPKLIVASVSDRNRGFLTSVADPIEALYIELDTSQETTYAAPQPERWCAFRNLVVLQNVNGETVLGGRTK